MNRFFTVRRLLLVCLTGVLGTLAFPLAFPVGPRHELAAGGLLEPLAFVCLLPALVAMRGLRPGKAFLTGFLAGMVFFTGTFWWVNVAMTTFGGMPNFLSVPALELLVAWCAVHWGLAFGLTRFFAERNGWPVGLTFAPVWMATELMRNYFCSGYPWANLGYSQARNLYFSQVAAVVGIYGIAFLIALVNGALYEVLRARVWKERAFPKALVAAAVATLVLGTVYGAVRVKVWEGLLANADRVKVAVVQGNIDQKLKNEQGRFSEQVLSRYNPPTLQADAAGADLIIWPEASYPRPFPLGTQAIDGTGLSKAAYNAHLILGVDLYNPADYRHGSQNAAFLLTPDLRVSYKYAKYHLVPFGEYVLFDLDKYLPIDSLVPGTFVPGNELKPIAFPVASLAKAGRPRTVKVGIEICYDAIFPEISRAQANAGADLLVNITNDAWYGFSSAPYQFLRMVQMRAIETGLPVARAANTGISGFIDPLGRISETTELGIVNSDGRTVSASQLAAPTWRMQDVAIVPGSRTVYSVVGDVPSYLAAAFCLAGLVLGIRKGLRRGKVPRGSLGI
ncbi:MAG: apolipoprotein N-acyltransferase [Myxococcaceae bacterium]